MKMNPICSLAIGAGLAAPFLTPHAHAFDIDLREVDTPQAAIATAFAPARYATVDMNESVRMLALPVGGELIDLDLERFDVWTDDAVFVIDNAEHAKPDITLLRGSVVGKDDSLVVVGIGAHATNGFIEMNGTTYSISSGGIQNADAQNINNQNELLITDLAEIRLDEARPNCAIDEGNFIDFAPLGQPVYDEETLAQHGNSHGNNTRGSTPCRVARIAIDSDYEWTQERFGGNAVAAAEYSLFLMAAISEVYQRDVNVRLAVPYLRTFSSNVDPYNGTTEPDPLNQVRDHWRAAQQHVERDLTHLFTGANTSYGGVAYLSVMCNDQWGYGVSSYMDGAFPYPLQQNSNQNWDLVVVSHELGHNFGTLHTHDGYEPVIDNCGNGCTGNLNGTIMSYCHTCSGGLPNIDLRFHPRVQDRILSYLAVDAPCNLTPSAGANDDTAQAVAGEPTDIFVLANDHGTNCAPVGLASVDPTTAGGGTATIQGWDNPTGDPTGFFVRYTPAPGQTGFDSFSYTTTAGQSANVTVEILEFRDPEFVATASPGLEGTWYDIGPGNAVVPDFAGMTVVQEQVVFNVNFASTNGPGVGGPLADNFGAVFEGYIVAPADGLYTLETESDDGSLLYIGDELVVDNNGLHGMQRAGGQIGLKQGPHSVRIEFFENGGGAGLIVRWAGPGGSGVVPNSNLIYNDPTVCVADFAPPFGVLDLSDISYFTGRFLFGSSEVDIAEPIGILDLADITAFVNSFTSGCP
jgi:hypothetical protein